MSGTYGKLAPWIMAILLVGALSIPLLSVPGSAEQKKPARKPKTESAGLKGNAGADSVATARQELLRQAQEQKAYADSVRIQSEAFAARRRADSLKAHQFRKITNEAFGVGERLVFEVNYGFITAGEATMSIPAIDTVAGRQCYRVEFSVNSLPSFSWVYKVEDRYLTFVDAETIAPWKFEQHIREGTYRRDFIAEFDQLRHVAHTTEGDHPIPPYVHDIMSAFYFARTMDYSGSKVGDINSLYNFYKDTTYDLGVKFLGRQDLEVTAGTFKTIVVEPLVRDGGLFKSDGRIVIWLTDDERKIPVRVNTKVLIGSIDTELKSYSGLRGPLRSRIK